jgi:hypothetical protein
VTRKQDQDSDATVAPIKPGLAVVGTPAQRLAEKMNRRLAQFTEEFGEPVGIAMVVIAKDGTAKPFYQTQGLARRGGGWRSFLALASLMLGEVAMKQD